VFDVWSLFLLNVQFNYRDCAKLMCGCRKYPHLPHGWVFTLNPPCLQKFQFCFILSFETPPQNFQWPSTGRIWIFSGTLQFKSADLLCKLSDGLPEPFPHWAGEQKSLKLLTCQNFLLSWMIRQTGILSFQSLITKKKQINENDFHIYLISN